VLILDDDERRHRWFIKRFNGDELDLAETVSEAKEFLSEKGYDAIFLDHDLLPHHYESNDHGDHANTGYAPSFSVPRPSSSTRETPTRLFQWCKSCANRDATSNTAPSRCLI